MPPSQLKLGHFIGKNMKDTEAGTRYEYRLKVCIQERLSTAEPGEKEFLWNGKVFCV